MQGLNGANSTGGFRSFPLSGNLGFTSTAGETPNTVTATGSSRFWDPCLSLPHLWPSRASLLPCCCSNPVHARPFLLRIRTLTAILTLCSLTAFQPMPCMDSSCEHEVQCSLRACPCAHLLMEACGFGGIQPAPTCAIPLNTGNQLLPAGIGFSGSPSGMHPVFGPNKPLGNSNLTASSVPATAFEGEILSPGRTAAVLA